MPGLVPSSEIKLIETLIRIKFLKKENKVFQYFIFDNEKITQKIFDKRFLIHDIFEQKIREMGLCFLFQNDIQFVERIDGSDRVTMVYSVVNEIDDKNYIGYYFTLAGFISKSPGCSTCIYNKDNNREFITCGLKNKIFPKPLKSCSVFSEKGGLFKT
jgi:hypothetical protein